MRGAAVLHEPCDHLRPFEALECLVSDAEAHARILARSGGGLVHHAAIARNVRSRARNFSFRSRMAENSAMAKPAPTEEVLERSADLDKRSVSDILRVIHEEDAVAHAAVGRVLDRVEEAVDVLVSTIGGGGIWYNVGAGTSGRIGVLDASEIPPTFGLPPTRVQGVIAGGDRALRIAVEGAEDNHEAGAWELRERGLTMGDAVVAISASGTTPYVLGALEAAHEVGARSIAITCNPASPLAEAAEISIAPLVGPEVIAGSTRMKGGAGGSEDGVDGPVDGGDGAARQGGRPAAAIGRPRPRYGRPAATALRQ